MTVTFKEGNITIESWGGPYIDCTMAEIRWKGEKVRTVIAPYSWQFFETDDLSLEDLRGERSRWATRVRKAIRNGENVELTERERRAAIRSDFDTFIDAHIGWERVDAAEFETDLDKAVAILRGEK